MTMALSDYEKEVLAQLEQQLRSDDPELGSSFDEKNQQFEDAPRRVSKLNLSPRVVGVGVIAFLIGVMLLIVGVSIFQSTMVVGVGVALLGFLSMLFALTLPMNKKASAWLRSSKGSAPQEKKTFMERQEEKWDERRNRQ